MQWSSHMRAALQPERLVCFALICVAHGALLWFLTTTLARTPQVALPSVVGVLVSQAPVSEPKPLPPAPRPVRPKPVVRPKPAHLPPPPDAPPSERAVTAPPPEPPPEPVALAEENAPAPAAPPAPLAHEVGEADPVILPQSDAAFLNNPAPVYPAMSRRLKEQGRVLFDVYILPDGTVGEIRLRRSSGHARLDEAALRAVRRWRYIPAKRGDEPIPYWYVQPIDFVLNR